MASLELIEEQQKQRFMAARLGAKSTANDDLNLMVSKLDDIACTISSHLYGACYIIDKKLLKFIDSYNK